MTTTLERDLADMRKFDRIPGKWEPGVNGAGKRAWFLVRHDPNNYARILEYHTDKNGDLIRYTMGGAHRKATELNADPFVGWTMANVGCYWSRQLPDGRMAHLSTWQTPHNWGHPDKRSGYALTVDFERTDHDTLDDALAAFDRLAGPA